MYDRDIICLPKSFVQYGGVIPIPRRKNDRQFLIANKLIGKVQRTSDMDEHDIFQEMRSVFRTPMGYDDRFRFTILQTSGGDSKSLMVPELSCSYKWTASAIAGRNAKMPIYVLAEDELQVHICACTCSTTREHIKSTARSIMFVRKYRTSVRVTLSDGSLGLVLLIGHDTYLFH